MLNELLHRIVDGLSHATEESAAELHAMVDAAAAPEKPADATATDAADTPATDSKGK